MNTYGYQQQYGAINRPVYGTTATPLQQPNSATQRIRPVASLDEVRAMNIDFDGSVFYFPDYANRKIYTKQINMDGTASINMYELKEIPSTQPANVDFVTRDEFNATLSSIKEVFAQIMQAQNSTNNQNAESQLQEGQEQGKPQFNF